MTPLTIRQTRKARLWFLIGIATVLSGCLPGLFPGPAPEPSTPPSEVASQAGFHDPVLLAGGAGLILIVVGTLAGLIACQTQNCIGTLDPTQASTPQVEYGYPVMAIGLATGLPLYIGSWVLAVNRQDAQRRHQLLPPLPSPSVAGLP